MSRPETGLEQDDVRSVDGVSVDSNAFFSKRQGAAFVKHELLRRYLPVFVGKTGSTAAQHRVVYIDGFAGTGVYDDGSPGSPLLAARLAKDLAGKRRVECHYIERRRSSHRRLTQALASVEHEHLCHCGTAHDRIPAILATIPDAPLFAFLDPFGLAGLPFQLVVDVLRRHLGSRGRDVPTEVLLNFSVWALRRVGGFALKRADDVSAAGHRALETLDESLGGVWWRDLWRSGSPDREREVVEEYVRRVAEASGGPWIRWTLPVSDRWRGPVAYYLAFFTRHRDGVWELNDALSHASEKHRLLSQGGQGDLLDQDQELVDVLADNLRKLLEMERPFQVRDEFPRLFEGVLGIAREKHLRKAVKMLHRAGETTTDGRGDLWKVTIAPSEP